TIVRVVEVRLGTTRKGDAYLSFNATDRSGSVPARVWENAEEIAARLSDGGFAYIEGLAETFRDALQLKISHAEAVPESQVSVADFEPASRFEPEDMLEQLRNLMSDNIQSANVRQLVLALLSDSEITSGLLVSPAAKGNHHAFRAGLLEHTLSMCRLGLSICQHYRDYYPGLLDPDLVMAGALLHDIGKIWELSSRGGSISYTTKGRLVGHIAIGSELVTRMFRRLAIDDAELEMRLKHMVLSHHGLLEFGAVVQPQTPEAQLLHFIDQIDSRMAMFDSAVNEGEGEWSSYVRPLGRFVYSGTPMPAPPTLPVVESPAPSPSAASEPPSRPKKQASPKSEKPSAPAEPVSARTAEFDAVETVAPEADDSSPDEWDELDQQLGQVSSPRTSYEATSSPPAKSAQKSLSKPKTSVETARLKEEPATTSTSEANPELSTAALEPSPSGNGSIEGDVTLKERPGANVAPVDRFTLDLFGD
ncbi:MAG: HD domain-containing protein, partial [Myxococcales bacterium]|nr:HD domain-containing protein [Myxococcales bacterium]